jgi:hypothetical protein
MPYPLHPNDRVRLTREAVIFYGGTWPHWTPTAQGGGQPGTLVFAGERPHKPGAAPRPYFVRWDNGAENSYRVEDLERVPEDGGDVAPEDEPDDAPRSNIIPFGGRP